MAFFVRFLIWWILVPLKKGGICKKSSGSDRPLLGMDGQKEIGTSQPAWFLWKSRRTHRQRGFRMPQYRHQPLESKWRSLWHGEVIVLVVVPTAAAYWCQTSHHSTRLLGLSGEVRWTRSCEQRDRSKCPAGEFSSRFPCTERSLPPASATADSFCFRCHPHNNVDFWSLKPGADTPHRRCGPPWDTASSECTSGGCASSPVWWPQAGIQHNTLLFHCHQLQLFFSSLFQTLLL